MTYPEYLDILTDMAERGMTSGDEQSEKYIGYTEINAQRMHRLNKTTELNEVAQNLLKTLNEKQTWVVLTETWCGDAAQNLPVLNKMAQAGAAIELRLLWRDKNKDLMDRYLTNGSRSIPKLIAYTTHSVELFNWGPRPAVLQKMVMKMKDEGVDKDTRGLEIQKWYNADKGASVQAELLELLMKGNNG